MNQFADAIAAEASARPMVLAGAGRTLFADGDGLCYYCAGNDTTSEEDALDRVVTKLYAAKAASGADEVRILLTDSGSHKGHRYAIARAKPYQGQRVSSRRPKNWMFLRTKLEKGLQGFGTHNTVVAEADDLFGTFANDTSVIYTQDKDMRMVPGWHLNWEAHTLLFVPEGTFALEHNGKLYGEKWFWTQMLMGDTADNIPGLPKYLNEKGNLAQCGEVTAGKLLAEVTRDNVATTVGALYESYYGSRWLVELLEQAALLWMRRHDLTDWLDCARAPWAPLAQFTEHPLWPEAVAELQGRIDSVPQAQSE